MSTAFASPPVGHPFPTPAMETAEECLETRGPSPFAHPVDVHLGPGRFLSVRAIRDGGKALQGQTRQLPTRSPKQRADWEFTADAVKRIVGLIDNSERRFEFLSAKAAKEIRWRAVIACPFYNLF
jgi:hypothetical protein